MAHNIQIFIFILIGLACAFMLGWTAFEIWQEKSRSKPANNVKSSITQNNKGVNVVCDCDCKHAKNGVCTKNIILVTKDGFCKDKLMSLDKYI